MDAANVTTALLNASNCSWSVVEEVFGDDNNITGQTVVCLSDMVVYSDEVWAVAGVFCFAAIAVACWNMYRHFDNYSEPKFQVYIVRIIFIIPVYALCSWLSLHFFEAQLYIVTFRDCFEAYIIWCFLQLIMEWMGGQAECVAKLETRQRMRHPWPFGSCCRRIILNATFIRRCKQGTLQFVFLKPVLAVVSICMLLVDEYDNPVYQWILGILYNISYTWALYVLFLLYVATKSFLVQYDPVKKFLAVKVVIFMTYYQALAFYVLPLGQEEAEGWSNALLCLEMFVFSILHVVAFRPPPKAGTAARQIDERAAEAGVTSEELRDMEAKRTLKNLQNVFSVTDVVRDTIHNFDPKYDHYVVHVEGADGSSVLSMAPPDCALDDEDEDEDENENENDENQDAARSGGKRVAGGHEAATVAAPAASSVQQSEAAVSNAVEDEAIEAAWAEQQAKLMEKIAEDGGLAAESTLRQQAMKLPLHKRRKGGYTRTVPTTYACAEDSDGESDREYHGDSVDSGERGEDESPPVGDFVGVDGPAQPRLGQEPEAQRALTMAAKAHVAAAVAAADFYDDSDDDAATGTSASQLPSHDASDVVDDELAGELDDIEFHMAESEDDASSDELDLGLAGSDEEDVL